MKKTKMKDNYFLKILIFFIIMTIAGLIFRNVYYQDIVNANKLNVITTLNNNQGYHPKVISFEKAWHGYKYWIAFTPYPGKDETKENPVINASNDLIHWEEPHGIENPLDVPNTPDSFHYNSDTHLLYNDELDQIELFWRYVNDEDNTVTIYKMTSKDGVNWNDREIFLYSNNRKEKDYVSPAIIYDKGKYKIWYVDKKKAFYTEKDNNLELNPISLDIEYKDNYKSWHIDVIYNREKNLYEMITCAYQDINHRENMSLYYTSSKDNISWSTPTVIMNPSSDINNWDSFGLYRSSLLYEDGEYYLFYSGHDKDDNVGIGIMKGNNIKKLKAYS